VRRFFNRVLTIPLGPVAAVCLTAAGLWVRSYSVSSCVPQFVQANQLQVHSAVGRLVFLSTREPDPKPGQFFNAHTLIVGDRRVPLGRHRQGRVAALAKEHWPLRSREMSLGTGAATAGNGFGFDVQIWRPGGPWVPHRPVLGGGGPVRRDAADAPGRDGAAAPARRPFPVRPLRPRAARRRRPLPVVRLPIEAEGQGAPDPHA
jgi:hypothetical protein